MNFGESDVTFPKTLACGHAAERIAGLINGIAFLRMHLAPSLKSGLCGSFEATPDRSIITASLRNQYQSTISTVSG